MLVILFWTQELFKIQPILRVPVMSPTLTQLVFFFYSVKEYSTHKYVNIFPLAWGEGPPQMTVTFQPVCSWIDLPIPANVRGILSITLDAKM